MGGCIPAHGAELFRSAVGFEYVHVPTKGGTMAQDIMAGRVDAALARLPAYFRSCNPAGCGCSYRKATRASNYPDLPTVAETVPGFASGGWFGFVAPARCRKRSSHPQPGSECSHETPDVRAKLEALGLDLWTESPEYLRDLMKSEYEKYGKVAATSIWCRSSFV